MVEREVIGFLKTKPNKMFTPTEISHKLDLNIRVVNRSLSSLSKFKVLTSVEGRGRKSGKYGFMEK